MSKRNFFSHIHCLTLQNAEKPAMRPTHLLYI